MTRHLTLNRLLRGPSVRVTAFRAELLSRFLNAPATDAEHFRVAEIFKLLQQLPSLSPSSRAASNAQRTINALLDQFRVIPIRYPDGWTWRPVPPTASRREPLTPSALSRDSEVTPTFALSVIARMDAEGTLARMRRCEAEACQRWFYAVNEKKKVCSGACRSKKFKQSDLASYRVEKAGYMRGYRRAKRKLQRARKMKRSIGKGN